MIQYIVKKYTNPQKNKNQAIEIEVGEVKDIKHVSESYVRPMYNEITKSI